MPNLIHCLDATSMVLLYNEFSSKLSAPQFYSIHDCLATTMEKVFLLKTILASVYTDLYSTDHYLIKFDIDVFDLIESKTDYKLDRENRKVKLNSGQMFVIHDIEWVLTNKVVNKHIINKIDSQYILV